MPFNEIIPPKKENIVLEQKNKQLDQEESIEWTGFNFIDIYHFCPDAQHVLNHQTIFVPGLGILPRNTVIYKNKNSNKYYLKDKE